MNAALDVTSSAVGPDTAKIAELVVYKHQNTGLLWAEETNLKLNRREGIWDALRRTTICRTAKPCGERKYAVGPCAQNLI
jgi:hypothetical protein